MYQLFVPTNEDRNEAAKEMITAADPLASLSRAKMLLNAGIAKQAVTTPLSYLEGL